MRNDHCILRMAVMIIAISLLWSHSVIAQQDSLTYKPLKHEIMVGYGRGTILQVFDYYGHDDHKWWKGNIHLQYMYNIKKDFGIGLSLDYTHSYLKIKELRYNYDENDRFIGGYIHYDRNHTDWFTVSAVCRQYWFIKKRFAMYSKGGVGMALASGAESGIYFVPNISPISFEHMEFLGDSKLKSSIELFSIGSFGFFNIGLTYTF